MADFRKLFFAFALVAVILGVTVPASAQQMTCNSTAVNPIIRAESYTDLGGDYIVTCTGGTPTTAGSAVPGVTITLFTNGTVTSKITATGANGNPDFLEAVLIVDDPNTSFNNSTGVANVIRHPILACGTGNSVIDQTNPGQCISLATGLADTAYDGNNVAGGAARPNIFQGQRVPLSNDSAVQFIGVPIDPPGPGKIHTYRITNVRLNAVRVGGGSVIGFGSAAQISAFVSFTTPNSVATQTTTLSVATIRNGLAAVTGTTDGPWPQCTPGTTGGTISVVESFASSFKARNWAQINANGAYLGGSDWRYVAGSVNTTAPDLNQNVPGVFYSTESGFEFPNLGTGSITVGGSPAINPPPGISPSPQTACDAAAPLPAACANGVGVNFGATNGLVNAGSVSNGTRFAYRFTNVPIGSNARVPNTVALLNPSNVQTGVMVSVAGPDANGAGGTLTPAGTTALSETATTTVIYEVLFANFIQIEHATVALTIAPTINLSANPPLNGTPQIGVTALGTAGFAPFYDPSFVPDPNIPQPLYPATGGLPIPRFVTNFLPTPPVNLFSFTKCACDLLFPWVVGDSTFTTSIVVDNTSLDPGPAFSFLPSSTSYVAAGQGPQSGRVTFWYYGTTGTTATSGVDVSGASIVSQTTYAKQQSTVLIPPGSYIATVVSPSAAGDTPTNGLKRLPGNFAGYVIAQSEFRYCHGIAAISAATPGFGTQTYVGLVMDNDKRYTGTFSGVVNEGTGAITGGTITLTPAGQLLPRTSNLGENFDQ